MNETTNYNLKKPELKDPADITQLDFNWDTIDAELFDRSPKGHGHALTDSVITGKLPITKGGTNATTAAEAVKNLLGKTTITGTNVPDANTLTQTAIYKVTISSEETATTKNYPYQHGTLAVIAAMKEANTDYVTQLFVSYVGETYIRSGKLNGSKWTIWAKQYDTQNKPTPDEIGAAFADHNHSASNITSGTLDKARLPVIPIEQGGTNAINVKDARRNLNSGIEGSYTGTNDSSSSNKMANFDTGARGSNLIMIIGDSYVGWLTPKGGFMIEHTNRTYFGLVQTFTYSTEAIHKCDQVAYYENGYIHILSNSNFINGRDFYYRYICM